jgi:uncharacterized protein YigE (DUF2233 family)
MLPMLKFTSRRLLFFLLSAWSVFGCNLTYQTLVLPTLTPIPTLTPSPIPSRVPTLETPDTGWILLQPGLERRFLKIYNEQNQHIESLYMFRLDQNYFRLDVAYHESPQSLESWQKETDALLVVNGGFYRVENEKYIPNGLTIVNGQPFGSSYESFGGMLAISEAGAELRSLAEKPYDSSEPLLAALQSFPVLVKPGGQIGFPQENEDNVQARRTVIGQDGEGRILFIVAPRGYFTLHRLSVYLTESDLNLNIAINLDGGPSTGILVAEPQEVVSSQTSLPFVILVYAR